jgi:hypothetical protein
MTDLGAAAVDRPRRTCDDQLARQDVHRVSHFISPKGPIEQNIAGQRRGIQLFGRSDSRASHTKCYSMGTPKHHRSTRREAD